MNNDLNKKCTEKIEKYANVYNLIMIYTITYFDILFQTERKDSDKLFEILKENFELLNILRNEIYDLKEQIEMSDKKC